MDIRLNAELPPLPARYEMLRGDSIIKSTAGKMIISIVRQIIGANT